MNAGTAIGNALFALLLAFAIVCPLWAQGALFAYQAAGAFVVVALATFAALHVLVRRLCMLRFAFVLSDTDPYPRAFANGTALFAVVFVVNAIFAIYTVWNLCCL